MATLIVNRERQHADCLRWYKIFIDGVPQASIRAGEDIAIDIKPGSHEITAAIDWCRSNPVRLHVKPEGHHVLRVGSNVSGLRLSLGLIYISFWSNRYLSLEEADPDIAACLE